MNCHPYDVTKISQAGNVCNKKFENNEKLQIYANKNVRIPAMKNFCTMKTSCLEGERGRGKIGSMKHIRNLDSDQNCFGNQISKVFFPLKKLRTRLSPNFGFCVCSPPLPPPPPKKKRENFSALLTQTVLVTKMIFYYQFWLRKQGNYWFGTQNSFGNQTGKFLASSQPLLVSVTQGSLAWPKQGAAARRLGTSWFCLPKSLLVLHAFFFYKSKLYKNTQAEIGLKIKNTLRTITRLKFCSDKFKKFI